jgi:hypothetical protein
MTGQARFARERWQRFAEKVVVEHRRFSPSKWLPHFNRLRREIADRRFLLEGLGREAGDSEIDPCELLIWAGAC